MEELKALREELLGQIIERDLAREDLILAKGSFADTHRKYERVKTQVAVLDEAEKILLKEDKDLVNKVKASHENMEEYKHQVQTNLELAHREKEKKEKDTETEIIKLRGQCRLMELKLLPLQNDVKQKAVEITQLRTLCDELVNGKPSGTST